MNVLVTGATGFTGSYVVDLLQKKQVNTFCFVRQQSNIQFLPPTRIHLRHGDLSDPSSLAEALDGMDALVNIASLGFGHAEGIIHALQRAKVSRAIFISTTAIFTQLNAGSKAVRLAAEQSIQESGLDYTILRPTMIYGSERDRNMCRLIKFLNHWPIIPIVGKGNHLQQPVYVGDVAKAVVQALESGNTSCKAYNIAGAVPLTYNQVIDTISSILQRSTKRIHLPATTVVKMLGISESLHLKLPIKGEQILRLNEDKAFSYVEASNDFGYTPCSFEQGIAAEIESMKRNDKSSGVF